MLAFVFFYGELGWAISKGTMKRDDESLVKIKKKREKEEWRKRK